MTDTPRTGLEFVDAGTTDIDQPVNNNALALDAVVGMNVVSATTTAEPTLTSPTDDGKVYILPAGRTGTSWAAQAVGTIAQWYSGNWYFYAPWAGLQARAADSGIRYQYTTSWAVYASVDAQLLLGDTDVPRLGTANSWTADNTMSGNIVVGTDIWRITAATTDGSDTRSIIIDSGVGLDPNRGAYIRVNGNEASSNPGSVLVISGNSADIIFSGGKLRPNADNLYDFGATAQRWAAAYFTQMNLSGAEYHTGIQSVSLTANTDNQTVNSTSRVLRIASTGAYNLTGLTGGASGRCLTLLNTSAFTITLTHDVTSTAANRFFCPNNASVLVRQNGSVEVIYDATSSRWRVIGA